MDWDTIATVAVVVGCAFVGKNVGWGQVTEGGTILGSVRGLN